MKEQKNNWKAKEGKCKKKEQLLSWWISEKISCVIIGCYYELQAGSGSWS